MNGAALNNLYQITPAVLDLSSLGSSHVFQSGGGNAVTIQTALATGTSWGSGVLTVERSNDGANWFPLKTPTTINSDAITTITPDTNYLRVRVSTAGSAGVTVRVAPYVSTGPGNWKLPSNHGVEIQIGSIDGKAIYMYVGRHVVASAAATVVLTEKPTIPSGSTILSVTGTFTQSSGIIRAAYGYFDGTNAFNILGQVIAGNFLWLAQVVGGGTYAVGDIIETVWIYAKAAI